MSEQHTPGREQTIVIRRLQGVEDMRRCVELQRHVWNYADIDTVPDQVFVVARETGGQVLGAFHEERLIGFALAFAGTRAKKIYLHSHMVAVVPEYQDRGVGRLLKLSQRDEAMARDIEVIEWTFDALQLKNAYFNLSRLGAIVRRYIPNFYGRTSSPLHAGLPTDRLVAEWWIRSPRVQQLVEGNSLPRNSNASRISIPREIRNICSDNPVEAARIQIQVRRQFEQHIAGGLAAVGFEFDEHQGSFMLEPYED
jgi:predicted GNAT superfamily acetyltransferase